MKIKFISKLISVLALSAFGSVSAQSYPSKPITLIAPFAPGASADGIARVVGKAMSSVLGQPVIVENKPGGGGSIGLLQVAHAAADGYTLGLGATGAIAVSPHLPDTSALRPKKDLTPIAKLADIPLVLVAGKNAGYPDLKSFLDKAKSRSSDPVLYATAGRYTAQHLSTEYLAKMAGVRLGAVPYRGSGPAVTDVLGGQIGLAMVDLTSAYSHIKAGTLVGLGVTSAQRAKAAPDLPTLAEAGVPGYDASAWMGLFGPAGLSPEVVDIISKAVRKSLETPEVQQQIINLAAEPHYENAQDFAKFTDSELKRWGEVLKSLPAEKK